LFVACATVYYELYYAIILDTTSDDFSITIDIYYAMPCRTMFIILFTPPPSFYYHATPPRYYCHTIIVCFTPRDDTDVYAVCLCHAIDTTRCLLITETIFTITVYAVNHSSLPLITPHTFYLTIISNGKLFHIIPPLPSSPPHIVTHYQ